jgi:hypothetical protein
MFETGQLHRDLCAEITARDTVVMLAGRLLATADGTGLSMFPGPFILPDRSEGRYKAANGPGYSHSEVDRATGTNPTSINRAYLPRLLGLTINFITLLTAHHS